MELFTPTASLRQQMDIIDSHLTRLVSAIQSTPNVRGYVYELPPVLQGEEEVEVNHIPVAPHTDQEAISLALAAFRRHTFIEGHSSKATYRLPGVVILPASCTSSLRPLVDEINRCKQEFKELVLNLGGRDEKFELVHTALPGVVTLQIYRQITILSGELQSVGFTWVDKQAITKVDKSKVISMLERSKNYVPGPFVEDEWLNMVEREICDIKRLPASAELRIRRPIKTHPMANLRWHDRVPRTQQVKASLPLLICTDSTYKVHALEDYVLRERGPRADRHSGDELIIERLHLYVRHP